MFLKELTRRIAINTCTEWVTQRPRPTPPSVLNRHVISGKLPERNNKF